MSQSGGVNHRGPTSGARRSGFRGRRTLGGLFLRCYVVVGPPPAPPFTARSRRRCPARDVGDVARRGAASRRSRAGGSRGDARAASRARHDYGTRRGARRVALAASRRARRRDQGHGAVRQPQPRPRVGRRPEGTHGHAHVPHGGGETGAAAAPPRRARDRDRATLPRRRFETSLPGRRPSANAPAPTPTPRGPPSPPLDRLLSSHRPPTPRLPPPLSTPTRPRGAGARRGDPPRGGVPGEVRGGGGRGVRRGRPPDHGRLRRPLPPLGPPPRVGRGVDVPPGPARGLVRGRRPGREARDGDAASPRGRPNHRHLPPRVPPALRESAVRDSLVLRPPRAQLRAAGAQKGRRGFERVSEERTSDGSRRLLLRVRDGRGRPEEQPREGSLLRPRRSASLLRRPDRRGGRCPRAAGREPLENHPGRGRGVRAPPRPRVGELRPAQRARGEGGARPAVDLRRRGRGRGPRDARVRVEPDRAQDRGRVARRPARRNQRRDPPHAEVARGRPTRLRRVGGGWSRFRFVFFGF